MTFGAIITTIYVHWLHNKVKCGSTKKPSCQKINLPSMSWGVEEGILYSCLLCSRFLDHDDATSTVTPLQRWWRVISNKSPLAPILSWWCLVWCCWGAVSFCPCYSSWTSGWLSVVCVHVVSCPYVVATSSSSTVSSFEPLRACPLALVRSY